MKLVEPKVSIIIPIYNSEKYLAHCINGILSQTYNNLEIILVNDGSIDSSQSICNDFAGIDSRILVLNKKNGGLSDARNSGLEVASGEYICFFDSDDYIEKETIEAAVNTIEANCADVAIWAFSADHVDDKERLKKSVLHRTTISGTYSSETFKQIEVSTQFVNILGYAWNKMYRHTLIKGYNFKFKKGIALVEDILFNAPLLSKAKKIVFIDRPFTHYVQRPLVSLGRKYYSDYYDLKMSALKAINSLLENWNIESVKRSRFISLLGYKYIIGSLRRIAGSNQLDFFQKKNQVLSICNKPEVIDIIDNVEIGFGVDFPIKYLIKFKQASPLLIFLSIMTFAISLNNRFR